MNRKQILVIFWILISLIGLFFINVWFRHITPSENSQFEMAINSYKQKVFRGKIIEKYIDKNEHKNKKVIVDEGNFERIILFNIETSGIYDFLEIGDSVFKNAGSLQVRVIRHDLDTVLRMEFSGIPDKYENN